ncbi:hypothetical protein AB1Y20_009033 [Prymnesium parvum]|uniref:ABC transporter domain-containing protein n=1 Tax=Prymnesium parvum TaxID=97485 RepID=A0AB34K2P1_PRYPA
MMWRASVRTAHSKPIRTSTCPRHASVLSRAGRRGLLSGWRREGDSPPRADDGAVVCSLHAHDVTVGEPPRTLVRALTLTIREGERWAIAGENGSGKTVTSALLTRRVAAAAAAETAEHISFDSHRRLLRDEALAFRESRCGPVELRATAASYLFPHLRPPLCRQTAFPLLSPMTVRYDCESSDPQLAALEAACHTGAAAALLHAFSLFDARHRPLYVLSTGQLRKVQLLRALLAPPRLLLLDEALDGLDDASRAAAIDALTRLPTRSALAMVAHRQVDLPPAPTHALLLGKAGGTWRCGPWEAMEAEVRAFLRAEARPPVRASPPAAAKAGGGAARALVEMRGVSLRYAGGAVVFQPPLTWTVREGENWAVRGANGTGKTTLVELITGDNVLSYTQDISLFGRKKGSGESVADIRRQLGVISHATHMEYANFADPSLASQARMNGFARPTAHVSTWDVVLSGFFDSVGLYTTPNAAQLDTARYWVARFELEDLVVPPKKAAPLISARLASGSGARYAAACAAAASRRAHQGSRNFCHLSFGEQKLVLLCRAMVKQPRLLLLDEPSHGLSSANRTRLLRMLSTLADDPDVALVHVTHRQDEVEELGFSNVLQL